MDLHQHAFLDQYYDRAIKVARKHLDADVPVVLFSWQVFFPLWRRKRFPKEEYGRVAWDTHIYTGGHKTTDDALHAYDLALLLTRIFEWYQDNDVIVAEFALSNLRLGADMAHHDEWQKYADGVFKRIKRGCSGGALLWNYDCQWPSWSMKDANTTMGIAWNLQNL